MLILLGVLASLGFALGLCAGLEAFASLQWLWLLPVSFLGCFLAVAALAFLFFKLMALRVPMEVMPEEDSPFYRKMVALYLDALLPIMRTRLVISGKEKLPEGRFLLVCNHISDADPVALLAAFRESQLAFISKRENDERPLVGPMMRKLLCQPINRENDREALKTILRCVQLLKDDKVSVAVFPEGYTSLDGLLRPFRSGVFKIAQKAGVPVVVCTLRNTRYVFQNIKRLKPTTVYVDVLDVLQPEDTKGLTAVAVSHMAYEMMAQHLGEDNVYHTLDSQS